MNLRYAKEVEELPQDNEEAHKVLPKKPTMDKEHDSAHPRKWLEAMMSKISTIVVQRQIQNN